MNKTLFNTIDEAIGDFRKGGLLIVVDDYDQDGTGNFITSVEHLDEDKLLLINKYSNNLIKVVSSKEKFNKLNIKSLYEQPSLTTELAHALSIKLKNSNNALETINSILNNELGDYSEKGHIIPVITHSGGVLKRAGRTEALFDLLKLSKLKPMGITSLIINKTTNEPYKLDELNKLRDQLNLSWITISDLISYRSQKESFMKRAAAANLPTAFGNFKIVGFENEITKEHHVALVKGDISAEDEVIVRVHSECLTGDAFGSLKCDCGEQLHSALSKIEEEGRGILVYLRQEGRGIGLINKIKAYHLQDEGLDTVEANLALGFAEDLRDYGVGAQMLSSLGVHKIKLMTNNPLKLAGLDGYGLEIVDRIPIQLNHNERNIDYMKTKKEKMGHILKFKK